MTAAREDRPLRGAVNLFLIDWAYRFGRWTAVAILIFLLLPFLLPPIYVI